MALFALGSLAVLGYLYRSALTPTLAQIAFIFVAIFTALNKVYSPQYVLWLTPLAILAMRDKKDRPAFWVWQGAELLYHLAIWEYLASYSGSHFGLPARAYATATFIRIAATIFFAIRVSTRSRAPQIPEFLISQTEGYA